MAYAVKEIFYTLQGEGANVGRPAIFCRFAGCSLWSGREEDRGSAICAFCDTDFVGVDSDGGGRFATASELTAAIVAKWPNRNGVRPFVVCTGGEPLLQLDPPLIDAFHGLGFEIAVETNGSIDPPEDLDWITVSPKAGALLRVRQGSELKLVFPQVGIDPQHLVQLRFEHFWLQPMDGPDRDASKAAVIRYCLANPPWRLSLQTQKLIGIR